MRTATSSPRSRSGGSLIEKTFSRKYRSLRNRPSSTIFSRSALVAAMSRTSVWTVSVAADPLEALFLDQAQDLRLGQRGHFADFVEEDRAAVALLELADPLAVGPGEGALLVAEQFAFQERSRGWRRS